MKKILKRLLISTALITPIAISTPLLLTSCATEVGISAETPPIFDNITAANLIKPVKIDETKEDLCYLFDITNNDFAEKIENPTFAKVYNSTPGPKLDAQVKSIINLINESIKTENNKIKFNINNTETVADSVTTYDSDTLTLTEQFNAVKTLFSKSRITNILESKTTDGNISDHGASFLTDTFINWDKMSELKDNIESKLKISVGKGTEIMDKPLTTSTVISFVITPKNNYVWPGLNTSHPIFMNVEFEQNEKSTLFDGGFALDKQPKYNTTDNAFVFNANLSKDVFGKDNSSKVIGTKDIKKWLEDGDFHTNTMGGSDIQNVGEDKFSGVASRIKTLFSTSYLTGLKTTFVDDSTEANFNGTFITDYIQGANNIQNERAINQENIKLSSVSATKAKMDDSKDKNYVISLSFGLIDTTTQEWFGISDPTNKNKTIKFNLTVNLA